MDTWHLHNTMKLVLIHYSIKLFKLTTIKLITMQCKKKNLFQQKNCVGDVNALFEVLNILFKPVLRCRNFLRRRNYLFSAPAIYCPLKLYYNSSTIKKYVSVEVFLHPSILQTDHSKYLFKKLFLLRLYRPQIISAPPVPALHH